MAAGSIVSIRPAVRWSTANANHQQTLVLRLAGIWKPLDAVTITPSIFYQNNQEHDVSTYWPSASNPSSGVFNNANPDRTPVPDRFYLPALKIDVDLGGKRLVSNTSYYVRDELTGYEGTVYNLSYYQGIGWPAAVEAIDVNPGVLPADRHQRRAPAARPDQLSLPGDGQEPAAQLHRGTAPAVRRPGSPWTWTVGAFFQASRELSLEQIHDPMADALLEALYGARTWRTSTASRCCPTAIHTTTSTSPTTTRLPASARSPMRSPTSGN
jgi:iron complex outermembrane receptor protein